MIVLMIVILVEGTNRMGLQNEGLHRIVVTQPTASRIVAALDRIIRSVRESRGMISGKLRKEHPLLKRPEIAEELVRAIREEFPWTPAGSLLMVCEYLGAGAG